MTRAPCGKKLTSGKSRTREIITGLFARGQAQAAFTHRIGQCVHASDCGRLCERLVKAPGKALVWCVDPQTGERTELYPALEDAGFRCPQARF